MQQGTGINGHWDIQNKEPRFKATHLQPADVTHAFIHCVVCVHMHTYMSRGQKTMCGSQLSKIKLMSSRLESKHFAFEERSGVCMLI